jgi:ketosteroid isomerase-like protein
MSQENVEIVRGVRIALSPLSERASQRRTLDDRLFVCFPVLYRLFSGAVLRMPPGSRIRRLMIARASQRAYAAGNRRDFERLLMALDPELEYRPRGGLYAADLPTVVHGRDEYREVWETTLDAFEDLRIESEEIFDFGDKQLVTVEFRAHGSGSGVPVSQRVFEVLEIRRGLVVRAEDFEDRSEALEAAGLSE